MRMIKWKLVVTIVCLILIVSTYFTSRLKTKFDSFILVPQRTDLVPLVVFIHIQKTAGSEFERAIVRRLAFQSQSSCQCPMNNHRMKRPPNVKLRCNCTRDNQPWLISRFSVGWLCGVHADWTNYHRCLPTRMNAEYGFHPRKYVSRFFLLMRIRKLTNKSHFHCLMEFPVCEWIGLVRIEMK